MKLTSVDHTSRTLTVSLAYDELPMMATALEDAIALGADHGRRLGDLLALLELFWGKPLKQRATAAELPPVITGPGGDYRRGWPPTSPELTDELVGGSAAGALAEASASP